MKQEWIYLIGKTSKQLPTAEMNFEKKKQSQNLQREKQDLRKKERLCDHFCADIRYPIPDLLWI